MGSNTCGNIFSLVGMVVVTGHCGHAPRASMLLLLRDTPDDWRLKRRCFAQVADLFAP